MSRRGRLLPLAVALLFVVASAAFAQYRFPRPEFSSDYQYPVLPTPSPPGIARDVVDACVLVVALILAVLATQHVRRRLILLFLSVGAFVYFGFFRAGCFCPIGTIQPVFEALFRPGYAVPWIVALFFLLPLGFALFRGRVFCAGVCPLGTLQDFLAVRPVTLPKPVAGFLSLFPPVFLALSIVSAATGSDYLICRLDPFVPLFRLSFGSTPLIYILAWLAASVFIARPYCRFLCPYGFLLNLASRLAPRRFRTAPSDCVNCRLCSGSCPIDALEEPSEPAAILGEEKRVVRRRLLLLPVLVLAGAIWGEMTAPSFAFLHPDVRLVRYFEAPDAANQIDRDAFLSGGESLESLQARSAELTELWRLAARVAGASLGLAFGLRLLGFSSKRKRTEFRPNAGRCVGCLRCVERCPVEHERRLQRPAQQRKSET